MKAVTAWFLLTDGHGSVRQLTDALAAVIQRYAYDAYGNMLTPTGYDGAATAKTNFLYSGESFNAATGLQYLRARYYDPAAGRFNRLDPFAGNHNDPQSLHKYLYTHGNPVMGVDPTGMFSIIEFTSVQAITSRLRTAYARTSTMVGQRVAQSAIRITSPNFWLSRIAPRVMLNRLPAFSQTTISQTFRNGPFAQQSISQVAAGLRNGTINPNQVPVGVINSGGRWLVMNHRSYAAHLQAGTPLRQIPFRNASSHPFFTANHTNQLARNNLSPAGSVTLRISGTNITLTIP